MRTLILVAVLTTCLPLAAQWPPPRTGSVPEILPDRTVLAGQVATAPDFGVHLVTRDTLAKEKSATLQVSVWGLELVPPGGSVSEHQGHVVYKLDNGQETVATSTRFQVQGLTPGDHRITVYLAGNDNRPIGPEHHVTIRVLK